MDNGAMVVIPKPAMRRLDFLVGEYQGTQTLYPPGGETVSYEACCTISREVCERHLKVEFIADIPEVGLETYTALVTFSPSKGCYKMWAFSSSNEEPLQMTGNFTGRQLVMISEPWAMPWGLQRLRGTFIPLGADSFQYVTEIWTPDGFLVLKRTSFERSSALH